MCCGQSRRQYQSGKTSSRISQQQNVAREPSPYAAGSAISYQSVAASTPAVPQKHKPHYNPTSAHTSSNEVALHYLQTTSILVKGPVSGRRYTFSNQTPKQLVDVRDVEPLLKTGFFRKGSRNPISPKTF